MKILMAMSGGIDSSISATLLKNQGHEIIGCYMMLHENENYHKQNIEKVNKVGKFLNIPIHILDLKNEFKQVVYEPFVETYKMGKTPNPCALCNRFIKLGKLLEFAKKLGCDKLATGHYVKIEDGLLKAAKDESKDQSYFLANTDKASLQDMIFPLGNMYKKDVKKIALNYPELIEIAQQGESHEICFVDNTYVDILKLHMDTNLKGDVLNKEGKVVGHHDGYMHYTIGKRKGFTVKGAHDPHYVLKTNPEDNTIIVGNKDDLAISNFITSNYNAFASESEFECFCKVRYRSYAIKASVSILNNKANVKLKESAFGVAPGQLAVFYDEKERVLGSGFIEETFN